MTWCSLPGYWQNENDVTVAAQLVGFLQQFLDIFSEMKGKRFYLTGESVNIHFFTVTESFLTILGSTREFLFHVSCTLD
jgi:hypothetical protein